MFKSRSMSLILLFIFTITTVVLSQDASPAVASKRIQLQLNSDEADAVLAIVDKHAKGLVVTEADWQNLFTTEPYVRLKKREAGMHREFTDDDFKKFVVSDELAAKAPSLRQTLDAWRQADLVASARRVLDYLPDQARIRAKVFPVIKPKTNTFVFETAIDPAIFLYLDPKQSAAKFENTVAHELHHIGFSSIESLRVEKLKDLPPHVRPAVEWMGAFGEGFAMLAAAGARDIDPQAASSAQDQARWEHDLANFNQDLAALQQFFLDTVDQKLAGKDQIDEKGYSFFGDAQGPWYTVGYKMAVIVEKRYGRKRLIECMLDPRELLATYNRAAKDINESENGKQLALWSPELMHSIGVRLAEEEK